MRRGDSFLGKLIWPAPCYRSGSGCNRIAPEASRLVQETRWDEKKMLLFLVCVFDVVDVDGRKTSLARNTNVPLSYHYSSQ